MFKKWEIGSGFEGGDRKTKDVFPLKVTLKPVKMGV